MTHRKKFFYEVTINGHDNVEVNYKIRQFAIKTDKVLFIVLKKRACTAVKIT
jgi:hypothetical protein